jgi:S1-C subfamily serine protease
VTTRLKLAIAALVPALVAVGVIAAGMLTSSASARTKAVQDGVVDVDTNLAYEGAAAAGTGIVLGNGDVLTNNHVIRGATTVRITDVVTGRTFRATVLGYSVPADVAVLRLPGGSKLTTGTLGTSSGVKVGDRVTAVGNAGGAGGSPTVVTGTVTGLRQSLTVGDGQGGSERLTGVIRTSAPLEPGDSGGPLLDRNSRVIGVNTAASFGFQFTGASRQGFAIPIDRALSIAKQIEAGKSSATVHVGPTSFLGIRVTQPDDGSLGALIAGVEPGLPADQAGLVTGDLIVRLNGHQVGSPTALTNMLLQVKPGTRISIRWLDEIGQAHNGTVVPASGPPQ